MQDLRDKTYVELLEIGKASDIRPYKMTAVFQMIHAGLKHDISDLTGLSLDERTRLSDKYTIAYLDAATMLSDNTSRKAAFKLNDGCMVEAVLLPFEKGRNTVCISSQVGCPIGCTFCATGKLGFTRNLTTGEILSQVYFFAQKHAISNIVYMGMGEPFMNYDNVIKSAAILNDHKGQNIAARKLIFSTVGIPAMIRKLALEEKQFRLGWSLASPFDDVRKKLIPLNNLAPIKDVVAAIVEYQQKTKRRVTIEYVVLGGINDRLEDCAALAKIAKSFDSHVNLIPYNANPAANFLPGNVDRLLDMLMKANVTTTVRRSMGTEIQAACGQLAGGKE